VSAHTSLAVLFLSISPGSNAPSWRAASLTVQRRSLGFGLFLAYQIALRDLAMFNLAIDSKFRGCVVRLRS
jgi:hypothetical protein